MYSSAGCAASNTFITTIVVTRPPTYPANALQASRAGQRGGQGHSGRVRQAAGGSLLARGERQLGSTSRSTVTVPGAATAKASTHPPTHSLASPHPPVKVVAAALRRAVRRVVPQHQGDKDARDHDVAQAQHRKLALAPRSCSSDSGGGWEGLRPRACPCWRRQRCNGGRPQDRPPSLCAPPWRQLSTAQLSAEHAPAAAASRARGKSSLMGASKFLATDTMTGVANTQKMSAAAAAGGGSGRRRLWEAREGRSWSVECRLQTSR